MKFPQKINELAQEAVNLPREEKYFFLAYNCYSGGQTRHFEVEGAYWVSREAMRKLFGGSYTRVFNDINNVYQWFERVDTERSPAFFLTDKAYEEIACLAETNFEDESEWMNEDREIVTRLGSSMASKDKHNNRAIRPDNLLPNVLRLDKPALLLGLHYLEGGYADRGIAEMLDQELENKGRKYAQDLAHEISSTLYIATNTRWGIGNIPQNYQQARSGRWFTLGVGSTNWKRPVRKLANWHSYEYDLSNAQLSLMSQMSELGHLPALNHYLECKSELRREWADAIEVNVEDVKKALIAIGYGAKRRGQSVRSILPGSYEDFLSIGHVEVLIDEIEEVSRAVVEKARGANTGHVVRNVLGKGIPREFPDSSVAAHLGHGAEAYVIRSILDSEWGGSITSLIHDGFYTHETLPLKELEAHVKADTGFSVNLHCEQQGNKRELLG